MRASAALQILTTVMSGTAADANDWSEQHVQQAGDIIPRIDLDLGACLDVQTLAELDQNVYDGNAQPEPAWVENVIDMTSAGELTLSGDHAGEVPEAEVMSGGFLSGQRAATTEHFDFVDNFTATDNAIFMSVDPMTSSAVASGEASTVQSFAQIGSLSSAALGDTTATSTIDLTDLEQFMTLDVDTTSKPCPEASDSFSGNIPSALWNLDMTLPASEDAPSTSTAGGRDVKSTLKNRLYSRGSLSSVSLDNDVSTCSRHSLSSSSSSLTQSFEDEEVDDPVRILEKREKNRIAAQKCRNRKRDKTDNLQKNVARLEERQERLKVEVQKLRDERETLEEIINVHGMVCPKIRKVSNS